MQNYNFDQKQLFGDGTIYTCLDNGAPERPESGEPQYTERLEYYRFPYGLNVDIEQDLSVWDGEELEVTVSGYLDSGDVFYVYNSSGDTLYTFYNALDEVFTVYDHLVTGRLVTGSNAGGSDIDFGITDLAPSGEDEPPFFSDPDPEELYFWEYRSSIIVSLSITNTNIKAVKAIVSIEKEGGDVIPVIYDIEIPSNSTLVAIGGDHKVFLEHEDSLVISYKDATDPSLVVATASIMNIYDYGHIPPIWRRLNYFGDVGAFGNGESNDYYIDRIDFVNDTISLNFGTINRYYNGKSCGSDSVTCVWAGGYSSYNYMESMLFSSFVFTNLWGTLYDGTGYLAGGANAITFLNAGGYNRQSSIQYHDFASGGAGTFWGSLYQGGRSYLMSCNSFNDILWMGGYYVSSTISASSFASSGNSTYWGDLFRGTQYYGAATGNEIMGLSHGDVNTSSYKEVHKYLFDSGTGSTHFGDLGVSYSMYELGAVSNSTKALFGGDERYSNDLFAVDFAAEFNTSFWGYCSYFDGGNPTGGSGN